MKYFFAAIEPRVLLKRGTGNEEWENIIDKKKLNLTLALSEELHYALFASHFKFSRTPVPRSVTFIY